MDEYIVNTNLSEMDLGDEEGVVLFDPETENTHVLDNISQDIIDQFKEKNTIDKAVDALAAMYEADRNTIYDDVCEFVKSACRKNILVNAASIMK